MEPIKPGYKTSEFWMQIVSVGAIASLQKTVEQISASGLPPWAVALITALGPLVIAYLSKGYLATRADAKSEWLNLYAERLAEAPAKPAALPTTAADAAKVLAAEKPE